MSTFPVPRCARSSAPGRSLRRAHLQAHRAGAGLKYFLIQSERREIFEALHGLWTSCASVVDLTQSADLLDAAVCVLAGSDFMQGRAMSPEDRPLAEREGWIWTSRPERS
jgi:hypothetical protein